MAKRIPTRLREELIKQSGGRCALCGRDSQFLAIDHIMPLSLGGSDSLDNLQVLCASCNVRKADKPPSEFPRLQQEVEETYRFERAVAAMLSAAGFGVLSDATGPDAGVDLVARRRTGRQGERIDLLVECKSGVGYLSAMEVASFGAKVLHHGFHYGLIVSKRPLTRAAEEQARNLGVRVLRPEQVPEFVAELGEASDE